MLYNWDAVQFALALHEFDVAKHQPHPPGYLLYVWLGRLLNAPLGDPTLAYVALAMLFSAGTILVVYDLARRLYDRVTALVAASLLAVSPLFWFYGSVGLPYAGEAFAASVVAWFAHATLRGRALHLYGGAVALGLTGGVRPSVLLLLLPLWLACAWRAVGSWRRLVPAGALLAGAVLAWLAPMIWLSGGLPAYLAASTQLYGSMVLPTSVLGGSLQVTLAQMRYLLESVLVGVGLLGLVALAVPVYVHRVGWRMPERFLLAWILPAGVFYTLVHFGQAGYVLTFLPALVILLSGVLVWAVATGSEWLRRPNRGWALTAAAVLPLVLVNTGFFVSARPLPREFDHRVNGGWMERAQDEFHDWIMSRTAAALHEHEAVIGTYVQTIRALYRPVDTALVTELGNPRSYPWLRHAMFYMPEFPIYQIQLGPPPPGFFASQSSAVMILTPGTVIRLPAGIRRLVWFVDHWDPATPRPPGLLEIPLPYGRYLYVLPLTGAAAHHAGYTFEGAPR
jgi:hypothetical protein